MLPALLYRQRETSNQRRVQQYRVQVAGAFANERDLLRRPPAFDRYRVRVRKRRQPAELKTTKKKANETVQAYKIRAKKQREASLARYKKNLLIGR